MTANENITLVDNNNIISSDIEIAEKHSNVVKELNVKFKKDVYVMLCDVSKVGMQQLTFHNGNSSKM